MPRGPGFAGVGVGGGVYAGGDRGFKQEGGACKGLIMVDKHLGTCVGDIVHVYR